MLDAAIPISDRPVHALHLISDLDFFRICCVVCGPNEHDFHVGFGLPSARDTSI